MKELKSFFLGLIQFQYLLIAIVVYVKLTNIIMFNNFKKAAKFWNGEILLFNYKNCKFRFNEINTQSYHYYQCILNKVNLSILILAVMKADLHFQWRTLSIFWNFQNGCQCKE